MNLAPILLFVYNRPIHTKKTIAYLKKNKLAEKSDLYIFSDGPKNKDDFKKVKKVRNIIKNIRGFKSVCIQESKKNKGLAMSIINGVTEIIEEQKKVIVLEDDLLTSNDFLNFMNKALNYYKNRSEIWSISGYTPDIEIPENYNNDIFLSYRSWSWGWATWYDRWCKVDWEVKDFNKFKKDKKMQKEFNRRGNDLSDMLIAQQEGTLDSWYIVWCYNQFKFNGYALYPIKTKILNVGMDGSGTHFSGIINKNNKVNILKNKDVELIKDIKINKYINCEMKKLKGSRWVYKIKILSRKFGITKFIKNLISVFRSGG